MLNNRIFFVLLALTSLVLLCACSGIRYQGAKASGSGDTENAAVAANADAQGVLTDKRLQLLDEKSQNRELLVQGAIDPTTFQILQNDINGDLPETDVVSNYSKIETESRGTYYQGGKTESVHTSLRTRSDGNGNQPIKGGATQSVATEHADGKYYTFSGAVNISALPTTLDGFLVTHYVMTKREFTDASRTKIPKGAIVLIAKEKGSGRTLYHTSWGKTYSAFLKRVPYAECGHELSAMVRGVDYWRPGD